MRVEFLSTPLEYIVFSLTVLQLNLLYLNLIKITAQLEPC